MVVADVMEADGRQVAAKINADGGKAQFVKLDVSSELDWQEAVRTTTGAFGRLDILVNNAGISGSHDPDTLSTSAWDTLLNINAKGVFLGMKHAVPAMRQGAGAPSSTSRPSPASSARTISTWATTPPRARCAP